MKSKTWYDISTAPKDGSKFLVTDRNRLSDARWPEGYVLGLWEPTNDGDGYSGRALPFKATYWAPLPQMP